MGAPRFTGASQGHCKHWRRETQMSFAPIPPGRVETKYRACWFGDSPAFMSKALEFTTGPRFTGSDHSENSSALDMNAGLSPNQHALRSEEHTSELQSPCNL